MRLHGTCALYTQKLIGRVSNDGKEGSSGWGEKFWGGVFPSRSFLHFLPSRTNHAAFSLSLVFLFFPLFFLKGGGVSQDRFVVCVEKRAKIHIGRDRVAKRHLLRDLDWAKDISVMVPAMTSTHLDTAGIYFPIGGLTFRIQPIVALRPETMTRWHHQPWLFHFDYRGCCQSRITFNNYWRCSHLHDEGQWNTGVRQITEGGVSDELDIKFFFFSNSFYD